MNNDSVTMMRETWSAMIIAIPCSSFRSLTNMLASRPSSGALARGEPVGGIPPGDRRLHPNGPVRHAAQTDVRDDREVDRSIGTRRVAGVEGEGRHRRAHRAIDDSGRDGLPRGGGSGLVRRP